MASKQIAIIDNSVLVYAMELSSINLLNALKNIFFYILIPMEVKHEFERSQNLSQKYKRKQFLDNVGIDYRFYRLCSNYDRIVLDFVSKQKEIDPGEAEIIAQATKRQVYIILTDDKDCTGFINQKYDHFRVFNTLDLIVYLDISKFIIDYEKIILDLKKVRGFSSKDLRDSYVRISRELRTPISKKKLSDKTSLNKIKERLLK